MGNQWIHNFEVHLKAEEKDIKATREDGRVDSISEMEKENILQNVIRAKISRSKRRDQLKGYELILEDQKDINFQRRQTKRL